MSSVSVHLPSYERKVTRRDHSIQQYEHDTTTISMFSFLFPTIKWMLREFSENLLSLLQFKHNRLKRVVQRGIIGYKDLSSSHIVTQ